MAAAPKPLENFGGFRPSVIAQFPAMAGWREVVSGIVVPPRELFNTAVGALSVPGTGLAGFSLNWGAAAGGAPALFTPAGAQVLEPLNDNDVVYVEQLNLLLALASIAAALTVTGVTVGIRTTQGGTYDLLFPFSPPTLNAIGTLARPNGIQYTVNCPIAIAARELAQVATQLGVPSGTPITDWVIGFTVTVANSNAAAVTFSAQGSLVWRRFQGVSPS